MPVLICCVQCKPYQVKGDTVNPDLSLGGSEVINLLSQLSDLNYSPFFNYSAYHTQVSSEIGDGKTMDRVTAGWIPCLVSIWCDGMITAWPQLHQTPLAFSHLVRTPVGQLHRRTYKLIYQPHCHITLGWVTLTGWIKTSIRIKYPLGASIGIGRCFHICLISLSKSLIAIWSWHVSCDITRATQVP